MFIQRYLDCAQHYGFTIRACNVRKGNEKGRVENAVGYIKKNFLAGQDFKDFSSVNPEAKVWLENIANKRIHGTTQKVPNELFVAEKPYMHPLLPMPYDTSATRSVRATNRFRVAFDGNAYSVPSRYASLRLSLKTFTDRICIYHENNLIAKHNRSYDRNIDVEDPDHPKELLKERRSAREQRLHTDFLKLSSKADLYYQELTKRRMNARHHIRKILALREIYGEEKVSRAIDDAITYQAFSCEYIANILEQRERSVTQIGALHLTRRQDLLELDITEPNLSIYDINNEHDEQNDQNDEGETSEHK